MAFFNPQNANNPESDDKSGDEIFFGEMTLEEGKRHIFLHNPRTSFECKNTHFEENSPYQSKNIIEIHSESPGILENSSFRSPDIRVSDNEISSVNSKMNSRWDDSFLEIEKIVTNLYVSPKNNEEKKEFNNTTEVVEYILKNGPSQSKEHRCNTTENKIYDIKSDTKIVKSQYTESENVQNIDQSQQGETDTVESDTSPTLCTNYLKPCDIFKTPSSEFKPRKPMSNTPLNSQTNKKPPATISKKTPSKRNAYQHIESPVASYIKNSPQVHLLKGVCPEKPLPSVSFIPRPVRSVKCNKENVNLPPIAYCSAKNTKWVKVADEGKLPKSEWTKEITFTQQKAVMKHIQREGQSTKKPLIQLQEHSFNDLPLHQADVSVCTQKTAHRRLNK